MADLRSGLVFTLQSIVVGLAVAFVVVLIRPDLLPSIGPAQLGQPASYADAVDLSAPSVATVYVKRLIQDAPDTSGRGRFPRHKELRIRGHYRPGGLSRHQFSRCRRSHRNPGSTQRRPGRRSRNYGCRQGDGPRIAQARPRPIARHPPRQLKPATDRRCRARDRQPIRTHQVGNTGYRQRDRAWSSRTDHVREFHPNGRRHQRRQFGWRADKQLGTTHRHQHGGSRTGPGHRRHRFCNPGRTWCAALSQNSRSMAE